MEQTALCDQVARAFRAIAERQPLLLVLDDLQWADLASLDMLCYLGRHLQNTRMLIVVTYRTHDLAPTGPLPLAAERAVHPLTTIADEFQRLWGDIRIDLAQAQPRHFVDAYLNNWPNRLRSPFRQTLVRHTGGNALFVVELVRAMQERGDLLRDAQGRWVEGPELAWEKLPPRVEGAISYRIGQLTPPQQEMLEVASVEGEQFHAEVLAHVLGRTVPAVVAELSGPLGRQACLVVSRGLVPVGGRELARYRFRHGLFHSYIYGRLDEAARANLHGAVGQAIEALYADQARLLSAQLARHHEEAGQAASAARYLLDAGRSAAWVGAHREAIESYKRALGLLADQAPQAGAEQRELESALLLAFSQSLEATQGLAAPERLLAAGRAHELGQQLGDQSPYRMRALRTLADLYAARGEYKKAVDLARELLVTAERLHDALYIASGHAILAYAHAEQGNLTRAWEHALQTLSLVAPPPADLSEEDRLTRSSYSTHSAHYVLLLKGYIDQARRQMEQTTAAQLDGPRYTKAYVQSSAAMFHAMLREEGLARRWAEEALRTMEEQDQPEARMWCERILGWVETRTGDGSRGLARIEAALQQQVHESRVLYYPQEILLAEAYLAGRRADAALQVVERAMGQIENEGPNVYEAEFWRMRGDIVLQGEPGPPGRAQAEDCYRRALESAQRQGARLWELRATVSLARLWKQESKGYAARDALATLYATFHEGYDAPDLVEARALLDNV